MRPGPPEGGWTPRMCCEAFCVDMTPYKQLFNLNNTIFFLHKKKKKNCWSLH